MQHIEKLMNRDSLKPFVFLTQVKRDGTGKIASAVRTLIWGFNQKHAITRFKAMTGGGDFIVV